MRNAYKNSFGLENCSILLCKNKYKTEYILLWTLESGYLMFYVLCIFCLRVVLTAWTFK